MGSRGAAARPAAAARPRAGGAREAPVELTLEIGCEEMPAGWLPDLTRQLRVRFEEHAGRARLEPAHVQACSTPRRLALRADVRAAQADSEELVWGPSLELARDAAGRWTQAAEGFARKCGVPVDELAQRPKDVAKPDELNLLFVRRSAGRAADEVLGEVLGATLRALAFPKRMNWDAALDDGKGAFPFGRPIRWLLALLDGRVAPFTIYAQAPGGGIGAPVVTAGDQTRGHRFLPRGKGAGKPMRVRGFEELKERLRQAHVLLDPAERTAQIERQLAALGVAEDAASELRAEWTHLVEHPTVVAGRVPEEFRALPREVLETVLVHHQKYLPVHADGGVARFAAVTNSDASASAEIVRGMERVVVARLRDAAFFHGEDRKRALLTRVDDLAGVTFHQKLGSYRDKAARLVALIDAMRVDGALSREQHPLAQQAVLLCKADLTTAMVREFPELQGVVGGLYLADEGADPAVARAVYWHYHPIGTGVDDPPAGEDVGSAAVFAAVSLADKVDTLAGYFLAGLEPKGSGDPFGLRRAAQGAVRVLLDFWVGQPRPGLRDLIAAAVSAYPAAVAGDRTRATTALGQFIAGRLESVLESRGFARDEVTAVVAAPLADALDAPHDALERLQALSRVRSEARDDFAQLSTAFKRVNNILSGQAAAERIESALVEHEAEHALHAAVDGLHAAPGGYEERLRALAGLRAPVDRFFDDVLVMAEDERLRRNRLALLQKAVALFHGIADISKLGGQP